MTAQLYFAAPLFTQAEEEFNQRIADSLESLGYTVFLPQKACKNEPISSILTICRQGLDASSVVLAILDGSDADSGTCWECGYAVAKGIPVIGVRTDIRNSGDIRGFNVMLYYSATEIIQGNPLSIKAIQKALDQYLKPQDN